MSEERDRPRIVPKASTDEPRRLPELVSDRVRSWEWESLPRREPTAPESVGAACAMETETPTTPKLNERPAD